MAAVTRYSGKVVVVTGGSRGIGAAIVRAFVDSGAQVVFCDKDEAGGRALEQELSGTVFIPGDVTQERDLQTLVSETLSRFGHLDCVVNNAGYHPPAQLPEETSAQGFRQLLEVNLLGTYTLIKLALPHLRKSRGNIINISSLVGAIGQSQALTYVATKHLPRKHLDSTVGRACSLNFRPQGHHSRRHLGPAPGPHGPASRGGGCSRFPGL
ncbi:17-beta-hydroxysteroid dehydrogenase 14 isoform X2 [Mus musculus]|uniref:17-beta-hydroxysteroid dehydrogenase 14 isoform X2 n=1 Tax=Mus musculus TaxID=10090 RepID=UPI0003D6FA7B|nr:17-beta-hydroxysteroid dehydrogenase 14 isoform X2 [Mus musculus]|eukprot:XP_006541133.1 PREDICTED: 17-beta-hydroxysteroid dehydrogenase 14 isoform X2 [Mus musculus]